jgi:hypothetical protein
VDHEEYAEDEAAFVQHLDSLGVPHPYASRRTEPLGLDRNTQEGALLAFSSALRPEVRAHRIVAAVLLVVFALPVVFTVLRVLGVLVRALAP